MTDEQADISLEAFDALARSRGLVLDREELERMREGWTGLRRMVARLPKEPAAEGEPALLYRTPGKRGGR